MSQTPPNANPNWQSGSAAGQGNVPPQQPYQQYPYPQQGAPSDQPQPKPKKPIWKRWWFILIAVIIVLGVIGSIGGGSGSSSSDSSSNNDSSGTVESKAADSAGASSESTEAAAAATTESGTTSKDEPQSTASFDGQEDGDIAMKAGESVTVKGVTISATPLVAGDATLGATACSTVTLKNDSGDSISFNLFDWSLQQPSGTITDTGLTGSENMLSSGDIINGGSTTGDVCFDADLSNPGQYVLLYKNIGAWSNDRVAWVNDL